MTVYVPLLAKDLNIECRYATWEFQKVTFNKLKVELLK